MTTHIVYIPGLGDTYDVFRTAALKWWRVWGVNAHLVQITWYDKGSMNEKMERVQAVVDTLPTNQPVVLIGESAGATLALHTAAVDERITRVITLCGVTQPSTPVSLNLRQRAPALDMAVNTLPNTYTSEIHSIRAVVDGVVNAKYSIAPGAKQHVVWSVGHLVTIVLCLTVLSGWVASIAKKQKT